MQAWVARTRQPGSEPVSTGTEPVSSRGGREILDIGKWRPETGAIIARQRREFGPFRGLCEVALSAKPCKHGLSCADRSWSRILGMPGWGGRIRTSAWRNQNPLPYHLATLQDRGEWHRPAAARPERRRCGTTLRRRFVRLHGLPRGVQEFQRSGWRDRVLSRPDYHLRPQSKAAALQNASPSRSLIP